MQTNSFSGERGNTARGSTCVLAAASRGSDNAAAVFDGVTAGGSARHSEFVTRSET